MCVKHSERGLLAEAEAGEDPIEQVVWRGAPVDGVEAGQRGVEVDGQEFLVEAYQRSLFDPRQALGHRREHRVKSRGQTAGTGAETPPQEGREVSDALAGHAAHHEFGCAVVGGERNVDARLAHDGQIRLGEHPRQQRQIGLEFARRGEIDDVQGRGGGLAQAVAERQGLTIDLAGMREIAGSVEQARPGCEFEDENVASGAGKIRDQGLFTTDQRVHVWTQSEDLPTPDELVAELKSRGLAARVVLKKGSRKSGRRARVFHIHPGSGGPPCQVTIKRRFWDSYDLLSVPEVYEPLCRKYHMKPKQLRHSLQTASFVFEVLKPALGTASSALIFDAIVDVIEDLTDGIRTNIG